MSSPRPAQNRALLSLSAAPTTRPLSQHIMSSLYCLLRSGDDNFKVQILFVGGGGVGWKPSGEDQNSWARFQSHVPGGLWFFWGLPLHTIHAGAAEESWGLPEASSRTPTLKSHGPTPLPAPAPQTTPGFQCLGLRSPQRNHFWKPLLACLRIQMFMFTLSLSCYVNTRPAVINLPPPPQDTVTGLIIIEDPQRTFLKNI